MGALLPAAAHNPHVAPLTDKMVARQRALMAMEPHAPTEQPHVATTQITMPAHARMVTPVPVALLPVLTAIATNILPAVAHTATVAARQADVPTAAATVPAHPVHTVAEAEALLAVAAEVSQEADVAVAEAAEVALLEDKLPVC